MNMKKAMLPITLVALFGFGSQVQSAVTIEQLTSNSTNDSLPQISGNNVVWQGYVGGDWEIFTHDLSSGITTQVTDNSTDDLSPRVDGNHITWLGSGFGGNIYYYDIGTEGPVISVPAVPGISSPPQIANGRIVWMNNTIGTSVNPGEIYMYDIAAGGLPSNLSVSAFDDSAPQISDTMVGWNQIDEMGNDDPSDDVNTYMIYSLPTGPVTPAAADFIWPESPQNDGNLSVYAQYDGADREIYLKNNKLQSVQVTNNSINDTYPRISGNSAVWVGGEGDAAEIYALTDPDVDADGVTASFDNCTNVANSDQRDTDGDGYGSICDADFDNNGYVNYSDYLVFVSAYGTVDDHADLNGTGYVNYADYLIFVGLYGQPPGPSASIPPP